ncbi:MAG TPA: hypothetical protein VJP79_04335 [Nitrososphaera sp.]|jgi:hypothetical protein|nr:hypothetical protein [Nitrososphaera sp.]
MLPLLSLIALALLPEGSVRDEGSFLVLLVLLAGFIGAAIYLRLRRKS